MRSVRNALLLAGLTLSGVAGAQELSVQRGARLFIDGTSTVRKFTCRTEALDVRLERGTAGGLTPEQLQGAVSRAELAIPARQLRCGDGTMDEHMYTALQAKQHPIIRFKMARYEVGAREGDAVALRLHGELTLAGATLPVTVQAKGRAKADGTLQVEGRHELRMTDWGVKPPTLMLGALKVGDTVTLRFELALEQHAPREEAAGGGGPGQPAR